MKLVRFGYSGQELPGLLQEGNRIVDVSGFGEDYTEQFFETDGLGRLAVWFAEHGADAPEVSSSERLGPPIARPSKLICIGLNYSDHARESGMDIPSEPVVFFKATSSLVGPNDDLITPRDSTKLDYEVELAFVLKKRASYVEEADALDYVAGYSLHNDYSERQFQLEMNGQWVKGKSCDTFAPLGPFMATPDEVANPSALNMWLTVNGEKRQNGSTSNMIFSVPFLVSYLSRFMSLLPGDVVSTGTPAGVGSGFKPPKFLQPGDVVELGVDSLGQSTQRVVAYPGE